MIEEREGAVRLILDQHDRLIWELEMVRQFAECFLAHHDRIEILSLRYDGAEVKV